MRADWRNNFVLNVFGRALVVRQDNAEANDAECNPHGVGITPKGESGRQLATSLRDELFLWALRLSFRRIFGTHEAS